MFSYKKKPIPSGPALYVILYVSFIVRYTTGNAREETPDCQNQVRQKKKLLTSVFISCRISDDKGL